LVCVECIGRRSPANELRARVGAARRIAELEAVLRIALIENRKLSTTDDLTRVASRRFFSKHFPREGRARRALRGALSLILCVSDFFQECQRHRRARRDTRYWCSLADESLYQSKHAGSNRVTAAKLTDGAG
jgi:GGDEF domain-containing protein